MRRLAPLLALPLVAAHEGEAVESHGWLEILLDNAGGFLWEHRIALLALCFLAALAYLVRVLRAHS